ncbi:MAG: hypothetical protein AB7O96_03740 [Pseudobdellovibrionaceae bacterium]
MPPTDSLIFKVAQANEIEELLDYETKKLAETVVDENDRAIEAWHAKWRREALEHYLPNGWCFIARNPNQASSFSKDGLIVGYFLAQPLLFFEGLTQSLWIEHLQYSSLQARDGLVDLAYRLSREKHFQKVYFPNTQLISNSVRQIRGEAWVPQVLHVTTSKMNS